MLPTFWQLASPKWVTTVQPKGYFLLQLHLLPKLVDWLHPYQLSQGVFTFLLDDLMR